MQGFTRILLKIDPTKITDKDITTFSSEPKLCTGYKGMTDRSYAVPIATLVSQGFSFPDWWHDSFYETGSCKIDGKACYWINASACLVLTEK